MRILSIETSCDETGVAVLSFSEQEGKITYSILGEKLFSQAPLHQPFGGVYPTLAKREHRKNLPLLTHQLLQDLSMLQTNKNTTIPSELESSVRDEELFQYMCQLFSGTDVSDIDAIAVTYGPGLAPALWVGVNVARILSIMWNIPIIPVNHMEGHIAASLLKHGVIHIPQYPLLALLVSGAHTELVLGDSMHEYRKVGYTLDDASGEAFDKAARLLGLPYPGGPEISKLAKIAREKGMVSGISLPRPMLQHDSLNFSYSGLKTALRTYIEKQPPLSEEEIMSLAMEFENAIVETLVAKTKKALSMYNIRSFVLGGGVSANTHLRNELEQLISLYTDIAFLLPEQKLSTDNAIMIGITAYLHKEVVQKDVLSFSANPNLSFPIAGDPTLKELKG